MQNPSLFPLMKRLLFPYSAENPLTVKQGLRVLLAWILVFPLPCSLCILGILLLARSSVEEATNGFVFAFLSGACVFGLLGVLIIVLSNRAARIRQAWKAQHGRS